MDRSRSLTVVPVNLSLVVSYESVIVILAVNVTIFQTLAMQNPTTLKSVLWMGQSHWKW